MDPQAAKMIGAGIACIGMGGAGVGVGTIFGHYLAAAAGFEHSEPQSCSGGGVLQFS